MPPTAHVSTQLSGPSCILLVVRGVEEGSAEAVKSRRICHPVERPDVAALIPGDVSIPEGFGESYVGELRMWLQDDAGGWCGVKCSTARTRRRG
jgi:hypothetical protein